MSQRKRAAFVEKPSPKVPGSLPSPPYEINAESLCLSDSLGRRPRLDPLRAVELLTSAMSRPGFHLEYICRACENWKPTMLQRPQRRGAIEPVDSCFGCIFSHLDGQEGVSLAESDRDAAMSKWAAAKAEVVRLEHKRANEKSPTKKAQYASRLDRAHGQLKKAYRACQRLGFSPAKPHQGVDDWERPIVAPTRDNRRKQREANAREMAPSPSCRNCWNWEPDADLSKREGKSLGRCWARDSEVTRADHWCHDHSLRTDEG